MMPNIFTFMDYGLPKITKKPPPSTKEPSVNNSTTRRLRIGYGATMIAIFTLLHCGNIYYKTMNKKNIELAQRNKQQLQQKQRINKSIQRKLRKQQQSKYIQHQHLLILGFIHRLEIAFVIPMDIIETILIYNERQPFLFIFGYNTINLQKFHNKKIRYYTSKIWNFNGYECSAVLYPHGIQNTSQFVDIGLRVRNIPYNIQSIVVSFSFYDYQRGLQYHNIETVNKADIDTVYYWTVNTKEAVEKYLTGPMSIEYDCTFDVIQMNYYDGYVVNNKLYKINKNGTYDIYFSCIKKIFTMFEPFNQFYESVSTDKFGCDGNWCVKFTRFEAKKVYGFVKLLGLPRDVNKIVVDLKLIDPESNDGVIAQQNDQCFSYKNHSFLFFWCGIPKISRDDIKDRIYYKVNIEIKKAYNQNDELIDANMFNKYGIIE